MESYVNLHVYIQAKFLLVIVLNFERLCQQVFALHDDIRYAGIIDDFGSLIAGGMRKGIDSITAEDNDELYLVQTALRKSTLLLSIEPNVDSHAVIDITKDVQDLIVASNREER